MRTFCCQLDSVWEDKAANFVKAHRLIAAAKPPPSSLVLLPEMFATGFSMNVASIAEAMPNEQRGFNSAAKSPSNQRTFSTAPGTSATAVFLAGTALEFGIYLMAGLVTATQDGRGRNQAVVFSPEGKEIARYTKCQPFTLGGESEHYEAGQDIITFNWQDAIVAPFICYDLRFPELFRAAVRREAQILAVIASWPIKRINHWITLLQARAIENQAYVLGVNRTGADPKYTHNGRSLIVNPHGEILADAGDAEGVISAELDLAALKTWRGEFPALQDMRTAKRAASQT